MASFNRVILMGNLTRDVEIKYLQSGMAVAEIGLAVNDRRKDKTGNWVDEPTFVDVTLWDRNAEVAAEYLSKGSPVLIEGRLKLEQWEKDGQKRSKLKVVADAMRMVGGRGGAGGGEGGGAERGGRRGGGQSQPSPSYDDGPSEYGDEPPRRSQQPSRSGPSRGSAPPPESAPDDDVPF